jgi:hypothetical protein
MDDDDPLASPDIADAAPSSFTSSGGSPGPTSDRGPATAIENAVSSLDIDAIASAEAASVIATHVAKLTQQAVKAAFTPERLELLELQAEAAVEKSFRGQDDGLVYGSVDEWLRKYWRYTYRRRVSGKGSGTGRWKAVWWTTDEAVQRLEALWRSWEASRLDAGLGMSTWWINHAEPHMTALLSPDGPFTGSTDENLPGDPLPYSPPPDGLFAPDKQA